MIAHPSKHVLRAISLGIAAALGCGGAQGPAPEGALAPEVEVAGGGVNADAAGGEAQSGAAVKEVKEVKEGAAVERPKGTLSLAEAQQYVLALVNRDRAAHGLEPVRWDPVAAKAGQRHAEDMAKHGFTGHHGTDASVPEQRYTEAGGQALVMENAGCFGDAAARELEKNPRFSPESLEAVEARFINEKPPADGHRRNILTGSHNALGVGLAQAKGVPDVACMAQEFLDDYGRYEPLPKKAKVGDMITVAGEVRQPAAIAGVGLSRVDPLPQRPPEELLKMGGYPIPPPFVTYFPKGFKTPKPLEVTGNRFKIQVPLDDRGRAGRYGVSVWATFGGSQELRMISLRTIDVEKK